MKKKEGVVFGAVVALVIMLSGCTSVKTPSANVSVGSDGISVKTPGANISTGSNGVNVEVGRVETGSDSKKQITNVTTIIDDASKSQVNSTTTNKQTASRASSVQNVASKPATSPASGVEIECEIIGNSLYAEDGYGKCQKIGGNAYYEFDNKDDECSVIGQNIYSEGGLSCRYDKKIKTLRGSDNISDCLVDLISGRVVYDSPALKCELDLNSGTVNRTVK